MNKEEVQFLLDNGFTITEIMTMRKETPKPEEAKPEQTEPEESKQEPEHPKLEEPKPEADRIASLEAKIDELKKAMQRQNVRNAQQPYAEPERTIEDVFNELINPKKEKE